MVVTKLTGSSSISVPPTITTGYYSLDRVEVLSDEPKYMSASTTAALHFYTDANAKGGFPDFTLALDPVDLAGLIEALQAIQYERLNLGF